MGVWSIGGSGRPACHPHYELEQRTNTRSNFHLLCQSNSFGHADILMPMEFHVSLIGRTDLSAEIYRQLRRAIIDGRLRPGEFLPPSRELSRRLKVARTTVTVAYDRLSGEGFVASRVGSGTFVTEHAAPPRRESRRGQPDGALLPR